MLSVLKVHLRLCGSGPSPMLLCLGFSRQEPLGMELHALSRHLPIRVNMPPMCPIVVVLCSDVKRWDLAQGSSLLGLEEATVWVGESKELCAGFSLEDLAHLPHGCPGGVGFQGCSEAEPHTSPNNKSWVPPKKAGWVDNNSMPNPLPAAEFTGLSWKWASLGRSHIDVSGDPYYDGLNIIKKLGQAAMLSTLGNQEHMRWFHGKSMLLGQHPGLESLKLNTGNGTLVEEPRNLCGICKANIYSAKGNILH